MSALEITDLHFSYGPTSVLRGVDLTVAPGSITAVLGPSGSGKTTLLRVVAGFERARAGGVVLAGRTIDGPGVHLPPERRGLGYVPQEGGLFPHLSVAANVAFGLRPRGRHVDTVTRLLDMVGLTGLGDRFPHQLSGGQQQRVALARALALEPAVVLLDEPFASLDAALRVSVRADIVDTLRTAGTAVVLVTHDQQEALSVADQVAVLRDGRVAQVGAPREIYTQPVDAALAAFLGDANLVDAVARNGLAATAVGSLALATHATGVGVVLVRPEQLTLSAHPAEGLGGTVAGQSYQGHDSVVDVRPETPCGPELLRVRVLGPQAYPIGTPVVVRAAGTVTFWHHRSDSGVSD